MDYRENVNAQTKGIRRMCADILRELDRDTPDWLRIAGIFSFIQTDAEHGNHSAIQLLTPVDDPMGWKEIR